MECPQCGYVMDAFETECPRCARLKAQGKSPTPAPPPASGPTLTEQATKIARDTVHDLRPEPLFHFETPELGWPLNILLWFVIGINALKIIAVVLEAVGVQLLYHSDKATHAAGSIMWMLILAPAVCLFAAIWTLRGQRWAFIVYSTFVVLPSVWTLTTLFTGAQTLDDPAKVVSLVLDVIPAIAIFILVMSKWSEFE